MLRQKVLYKRVKRKPPARRTLIFSAPSSSTSFSHTAGSIVLARKVHTWNLTTAQTAGAVLLARGTHAWTLSFVHAKGSVLLTPGAHTQITVFNHNSSAIAFAPGSHGSPAGFTHTSGSIRFTLGVHAWSMASAHAAGSVSLILGSHLGINGFTHTAGSVLFSPGVHAWSLSCGHQAKAVIATRGVHGREEIPTPTTGGAVIVDLPKKKRGRPKKVVSEPTPQRNELIVEVARVISEEEAHGMASVYGAQMQPIVEPVAESTEPEGEAFGSVIEPFGIPESLFSPEPTAQPVDYEAVRPASEVLEEKEDDIALILAIIAAIG